MKGKLMLVVGPSGSGKGTLINHVRLVFPDLSYPKSATTREPRGGVSDKNYLFFSVDEFKKKAAAGEFLEWAEYGGNYYGTLYSEIQSLIDDGKIIVKELEVQGARQIREKIPADELAIVFVNAGTWEEMEERIRKRADMDEVELSKRRERYHDEISFMENEHPDFIVQNPMGQMENAKKRFEEIIRSFLG